MENEELINFKKEKLMNNIINSFFFKFDENTKNELLDYVKIIDEKSLDDFSSIYNSYLERYEKLDKEKVFNIHICYDNIEKMFKEISNSL
jgi:hypothetical protein